ncbi:integrase [Methanoculleus sp. FWC-SCC1]|uniref:Integrase n=1 Tax=Methanoculleus frigidifontis TaxID=2584085 RepID=A0ABT8M6S1_9EURY|nr:integrase [Methanoculleus sp. FWC-SCC1]
MYSLSVNEFHPHAIRHARLTSLTRSNGKKRELSEKELRLVAGWERNSAMPEVYVHLSGADVERKLLENAGFIDDSPDPADAALEPRQCPRCKNLNAHDALYCAACSMALDERAAMKVDESTEEAKKSEEYLQMLTQIRKDLGLVR